MGVGYAAWHYLPREQSVVAEKVPPVPDRLLASHPNPAPSTEAAAAGHDNQRSGPGDAAGAADPGGAPGARQPAARSLAGAP